MRDAEADSAKQTAALHAALDSFRQYRQAAHYNVTHLRRRAFYSLPSTHVDILSGPVFNLPQTFRDVDDAIAANAEIAEAILEAGLQTHDIGSADESWHGAAKPTDVDKARSTIRQLYRDWSAEGASERHASHSRIHAALHTHLPMTASENKHRHHVLVPGSGLGRLAFDLYATGYMVQSNELSYHQVLASSYIIKHVDRAGKHKLHPWALAFSNHLSRADQLRSVAVPEFHPQAAQEDAQAKMKSERCYDLRHTTCVGDFCSLYQQPDAKGIFDAVATCFFIDTTPDLITYIETVKHCLKPGGLWVNVGPLLWHFEAGSEHNHDGNNDNAHAESSGGKDDTMAANETVGHSSGSFELSNDEVLALLQRLGFEIVERQDRMPEPAGYVTNAESMLITAYKPSFWAARKPVSPA